MRLKYYFLLLLCVSCSHPKQPAITDASQLEPFTEGSFVYYPIKDNRVPVDLNNPQKGSLFDYFEHIELIPLETNDDVLMGKAYMVTFYLNSYYFFDVQQQIVYVFDDAGKFVSKIAKRGQGPGEYGRIEDLTINPFTGTINLLEPFGRLHIYDLSGNHIKSVRVTDDEVLAVHYLRALNENTYVFLSMFHSSKILYYDIEEMKILHQEYEECPFAARFNKAMNPFYEYHGKWYFYRYFDRETYEIGQDSLIKAYSWDFGEHNYDIGKMFFPETTFRDVNTLVDEARRFPYRIRIQGQNNKYVMAQICLKNEARANLLDRSAPDNEVYANLMYDKSTQECKFIEHFIELVEFRPYMVTNEYILNFCNHGELEKYVTREMLDETSRQKFDDLMNTKEEENQIIIKYYLR